MSKSTGIYTICIIVFKKKSTGTGVVFTKMGMDNEYNFIFKRTLQTFKILILDSFPLIEILFGK